MAFSGTTIKNAQRLLIDRFGLSVIGSADGILGPRTYNGLTMTVGHGWWNLSGDGLLAALGARSATALPSYPFPECVKIAQSILRVAVDGKLGPETWAALDRRIPSWKTRAWAEHMSGNIPAQLGAGQAEASVVSSAPIISQAQAAAAVAARSGASETEAAKAVITAFRKKAGTSQAAGDAADAAASKGLISDSDRDEVLKTTPGKSLAIAAVIGLGALGATWYLLKGRRASA